MTTPRLLALATATPSYVLDQDEAAAMAAEVFRGKVFRTPDLLSIFENTGIRTRKAVRPLAWYGEPHGWPERNAVYLENAQDLYVEVANKALAAAGLQASDIGQLVTVSSSGIATPSLEARAAGRMGFRAGVRRTPVFGLGCGGGVAGLGLAERLARTDPELPVLLVIVELSSLAVRPDAATKENIISSALFGDGAAAAVVSAAPDAAGRAIECSGEHLWPDSLDVMGWRIDPVGFGVILSPAVPAFVEREMPQAAQAFLDRAGLTAAEVSRYVCHPGGAKVVPAIEAALGLAAGSLDVERQVLAEYGNMSAPTALFVLDRVLNGGSASADGSGRLVVSAMGPGFTAQFVSLGAVGA
ncbi:type III polyketide synthase [Caulobacter sp. S45]|uniref:type III polyketide synthase n=1 Tax=Caulobacter sp. S45 TaxID=1641861 RepID=UPI00157618C8|nr:3-oxoacyl-[acyl-carrier-protein] synthase III C-terminal domain-containing protein [Caulobacter sp. S45]